MNSQTQRKAKNAVVSIMEISGDDRHTGTLCRFQCCRKPRATTQYRQASWTAHAERQIGLTHTSSGWSARSGLDAALICSIRLGGAPRLLESCTSKVPPPRLCRSVCNLKSTQNLSPKAFSSGLHTSSDIANALVRWRQLVTSPPEQLRPLSNLWTSI